MTEFIRFIGLRYFSQGRKKSTLSLISLISITGLSLGVATLITVLSVMDGLVKKMEQTVLNSTSHSNVYKLLGSFENHEEITKKMLEIEEVTGAGPVVFSEVLISSGNIFQERYLTELTVKVTALFQMSRHLLRKEISVVFTTKRNAIMKKMMRHTLKNSMIFLVKMKAVCPDNYRQRPC
jgi:ABC-type lipoprotein release transport system permease subunit